MSSLIFLFVFATSFESVFSQAQPSSVSQYNVLWTTQSVNSSESMPCGGGDIGLNVWVEKGEVLFYLSRTGAFDENHQFLKLGRVRVRLSNDPFSGSDFRQELLLNEGYVSISGRGTVLQLWVDVFNPMIHLQVNSNEAVTARISYENWRTEERVLSSEENRANSHKDLNEPRINTITYPDSIQFDSEKSVVFYHQNRKDEIFSMTVRQQGLIGVFDQLHNPLKNLIFGGKLTGNNIQSTGISKGKYLATPFTSWNFASIKPAKKHDVSIALHIDSASDISTWRQKLDLMSERAEERIGTRKNKTRAWWKQFWTRSHIITNSSDSLVEQIGKNYQLFRYMMACNAYGQWPTKFNGGLFTFDPITITDKSFTPDFRRWGGAVMTGQNQRLLYWPLLKSGDYDFLPSQFNFYEKALKNAELRSEVYWGIDGASFTEQLEIFGLPNNAEYGWNRPSSAWIPLEQGIQDNNYLAYDWESALEFCLMMIELRFYAGINIDSHIPFIESCLRFYNQFYQQRNGLDSNGHLIIYPGSGLERYKMVVNPVNTVAALKTVLTRFLELPDEQLSQSKKLVWREMLGRIPPIEKTTINGIPVLAPYKSGPYKLGVGPFEHGNELPELYPVYPWGMYGIGKPDLDIAVNTWLYSPSVKAIQEQNLYMSWRQEAIFAARLGLTGEAAKRIIQKMRNSPYRFPAFFEPGHDWAPDHNWGGSGMIGMQEMLMQTVDDKIYLLPAWPTDWDVDFKLHAPHRTVVHCIVKKGKVQYLSVSPESRKKDVVIGNAFQHDYQH